VTTWGVRRARRRIGSDGLLFPKRFSKLLWIFEHHSNTLVEKREMLACLLSSPEIGSVGVAAKSSDTAEQITRPLNSGLVRD
jgi:hypothetical protein